LTGVLITCQNYPKTTTECAVYRYQKNIESDGITIQRGLAKNRGIPSGYIDGEGTLYLHSCKRFAIDLLKV